LIFNRVITIITVEAYMESIIQSHIIQIGNSKGVRIPKLLLKKSGLRSEVEIIAEEGRVIVQVPSHPRKKWEAELRKASLAHDDVSFVEDGPLSSFDEEDWEW
jgi:antitoxin MazE